MLGKLENMASVQICYCEGKGSQYSWLGLWIFFCVATHRWTRRNREEGNQHSPVGR